MSITQIRNSLEKKGCQVALGVIAIALTLGFLFQGTVALFFQPKQEAAKSEVLGTVGKQPLTAEVFQKISDEGTKQFPQSFLTDPTTKALVFQQTLGQAVNMASLVSVGDDLGIKLEDKAILAEWTKQLDEQKKGLVDQLKAMGKIKDGASADEIKTAMAEAVGGRDIDTLIKDKLTEVEKDLANPAMRLLAVAPAVQGALKEKVSAEVTVTEEQLKAGFDEFSFDIINFSDGKVDAATAKANAEKAITDIKGGKKFEEVQKQFHAASFPKTQSFARTNLESDEVTKILATLKPGELSAPLDQFGQTVVYQLKAITPKLPADFDKNKASLLTQRKDLEISKKINEKIEAKAKSSTKWNSKGLEVYYKLMLLAQSKETSQPGPARNAELEKLLAEAAKITDTDPVGTMAIQHLKLVAASDLYMNGPADQKQKWAKAKLDALVLAFQSTENSKARIDAAKLAAEVNDAASAVDQLTASARANIDYTAQGLDLFTQQTALLGEWKTKKFVTDEQAALVQKELEEWQKQKDIYTQQQADLAKEQAEAQKVQEAEQAKLKEEEQKAIEAEKAKAGTPEKAEAPKTEAPKTEAPKAEAPAKTGN